jgi:hypothetical protein
MSRFKDFGEGAAGETEPVTFKLHGEEFTCQANVPGKVLLDLVAKGAEDDSGAAGAVMVNTFFKAVLLPESYERFDALATNPDKIVTVETIGQIVEWLMEQYADRPTERPELSPDGR